MGDGRYFEKNDLIKMIVNVSTSLDRSVNGVLIGGLAMMHHGAKESTKDIDIVFNDEDEIKHFIRTIQGMGFERKKIVNGDYLDLGAHSIHMSEEGYMLDLFLKRVLDGFVLSDGMVNRSTKLNIPGRLALSVLSPVDIFLFKSITLRESDLLDMVFLAPMIDDWTPFLEELYFIKHDYRLISRSYERLKDLHNEHQLEVPVGNDLKQICEIAVAKSVIHGIVQFGGKEKKQVLALVDPDEISYIKTAMEQMVQEGIITEKDGIISLIDYGRSSPN